MAKRLTPRQRFWIVLVAATLAVIVAGNMYGETGAWPWLLVAPAVGLAASWVTGR